MKRNFLVVAANEQARERLAKELGTQGYSVTRAAGAIEAERAIESVDFDAVVLESHVPNFDAATLRKQLRKQKSEARVIVLSNFELVKNTPEHLELGADEYMIHSEQLFELLRASSDASHGGSANSVAQRCADALIPVIDVLVSLIELDDKFFGGSSHKVMKLAVAAAEELGSDAETLHELAVATLLRDIGKVGVDPTVFEETGTFTDDQKEQMRAHVNSSVRIFEHIDMPWKVLPVIRHHHERYDGTGYPDGLRGREIPLGSRIIAVVDAYVAMTSSRTHRGAFGPEEALRELIAQTGRQFDPEVVEAFQRVLDKRLEGRKRKGKPRILIADGQEDFRRLVKMRLLNEGLEVQQTDSIDLALESLLKQPPDLALVDVDADSAEAFQLFQEMRADEKLCRIPFAFLSRKMDRVLKLRALREGVDDYLNKADDLEELVARVENILTREALRRDNGVRKARKGITGDLENLSLPDIVQTLAMGMKTACLTISSSDVQGKIYFENGRTTHAKTDVLIGEDAFYEMVRWVRGEFVIEHGVSTKRETIDKDSMYLLMEGLRLFDESKEAQAVS